MGTVKPAEFLAELPSGVDTEGAEIKVAEDKELSDTTAGPSSVEARLARLLGATIVQCVDDGRLACAVLMTRALACMHAERMITLAVEGIVIECNRPDVAVALLLQLVQQGSADMAAYVAATPVHRGRLAPLLHVTLWLVHTNQIVTAANLALELVRHGEGPAVADLMIAVVNSGHLADARDLVAVLIARKHADAAALVSLWMIYVGEAAAVAEITAALIDAGELALACNVKEAMVTLGEWLCGNPCYELVKMGRADVVAHMVIELVNTRLTNVVCACAQSLVMAGHGDTLADLAVTVADMDRPDVIAKVLVTLVEIGSLDLAKAALVALSQSQYPWVLAASEVEMVRQGNAKVAAMIQAALSRDGHDGAILEVAVLLLRCRFASEWAAISTEHIHSGEADIIARQLAGLLCTSCPFLAAEAAVALAHAASAKAVAEVVREMVKMGQIDAVADLAADLAQRALSVACDVIVQLANQDHATTVALLLQRLVDSGRTAAVVHINNCLVDSGHNQEAADIAEALAAQTDVVALMETLKANGARILPEVWYFAMMRHISTTSADPGPGRAAHAKSGRSSTQARSGSPITRAKTGRIGTRARSGSPAVQANPGIPAADAKSGTSSNVVEVGHVSTGPRFGTCEQSGLLATPGNDDDEMRGTRVLFAEKTAPAVAYEGKLTGQTTTSSGTPAAVEDVYDTAFTIGKS